MLWNVIKRCWYSNPFSRPSSNALLGLIDDLVKNELINPLATTPQRPALAIGAELINWPDQTKDFASETARLKKELVSAQRLANVWVWVSNAQSSHSLFTSCVCCVRYTAEDEDTGTTNTKSVTQIVLKVACLSESLGPSGPTVHPFHNVSTAHKFVDQSASNGGNQSRLWDGQSRSD